MSTQEGMYFERLEMDLILGPQDCVRDPAIEVAAVEATLAKQQGDRVLDEFMIL
jgi:hypothetical protein